MKGLTFETGDISVALWFGRYKMSSSTFNIFKIVFYDQIFSVVYLLYAPIMKRKF
jgi:hypothetical protein